MPLANFLIKIDRTDTNPRRLGFIGKAAFFELRNRISISLPPVSFFAEEEKLLHVIFFPIPVPVSENRSVLDKPAMFC